MSVSALSSAINGHGSVQAKIASRNDSPTSVPVNEKRGALFRAVASTVKKCNRAASGKSSALKESNRRPLSSHRDRCEYPASKLTPATTAASSAIAVAALLHR